MVGGKEELLNALREEAGLVQVGVVWCFHQAGPRLCETESIGPGQTLPVARRWPLPPALPHLCRDFQAHRSHRAFGVSIHKEPLSLAARAKLLLAAIGC